MKKEIEFSEVAEKTIERFAFSDMNGQCVITFCDGTFSVLGIELGYDRGDEAIQSEKLDLFNFGDTLLIACGVISREELEAKRKERNDATRILYEQRKDAHERAEYDRLAKKFGAPQ